MKLTGTCGTNLCTCTSFCTTEGTYINEFESSAVSVCGNSKDVFDLTSKDVTGCPSGEATD